MVVKCIKSFVLIEKFIKSSVLKPEMEVKKHLEILKEVMDEIETAQQDPQGLLSHQRRLALMLSLGVCELIELYFHKLDIIKSGSRIKHTWFRQKRIKEKLEQQIISPLDVVANIDLIIQLATSIEKSRDDLAYSSPQEDDKILNEKINQFLELKKVIEREVHLYG